MSQLGNINNSYGKQVNIAIANTYSYNVLSGSNLPVNSIIIASNVDDDLNDTGTYSLIATDGLGNPVRLTYTIKEGNGFYYSADDDAILLHIDNETIKDTSSGLSFDMSSVLGNDFNINNKDIHINMNVIPNSSKNTYGITKIDNKTIKIDDDTIFISTSNLKYSNNSTEQYGIGLGDNKTIRVDNGKISVKLDSLNKASKDNYGIVSGDNNTVNINNGIISVRTQNLLHASNDNFGISKPDNKTIVFNKEDKLTVNENNLPTASNIQYGLSKIDNSSLIIKDGKISVKKYDIINSYISKYHDLVNNYDKKINEFTEYLSGGNLLLKDSDIQLFTINETSVGELVHPKENEEVINMPLQTISAVFDIITTCDFIINIQFEEGTNEFPNVDILEVNYNDEKIYNKLEALDVNTIYKSTEGKRKKLIVKFSAKNYKNSVRTQYIITSINITVTKSDDHNKSKTEKYSIVRYNSIYHEIEKETEETKESVYVVDQNTVYWR